MKEKCYYLRNFWNSDAGSGTNIATSKVCLQERRETSACRKCAVGINFIILACVNLQFAIWFYYFNGAEICW